MSKSFDFSTVEDFDGHIGSSIMGYDLLDNLVLSLVSFFMQKGGNITDLGCTSGRMLTKIVESFNFDVSAVGFDIVDTHFPANTPSTSFQVADITSDGFKIPSSSVVLSVFTLQFIDPRLRRKVMKKAYDALPVGGAFILCEKEYTMYSKSQEAFTFSNYNNKRNSFTDEEILDKEQALRSVMHSNDCKQNAELINSVEWSTVDPFFQSLNFKGYLCIK